ncbi:hypothetical protein AVEN_200295-1 [Araneus ventricosus]|uniref:Uncharacterized protein n=1 Tax=Araneus ventricosus TaxID=182803 RepID=A0A4Y2HHT3_ARAVE|nr:hypothetical protein AVEN_200295-1 [Araneus ventricosus]
MEVVSSHPSSRSRTSDLWISTFFHLQSTALPAELSTHRMRNKLEPECEYRILMSFVLKSFIHSRLATGGTREVYNTLDSNLKGSTWGKTKVRLCHFLK